MLELLNVLQVLKAMDNDVNQIMIFLKQPERHFDLFNTMLQNEISSHHQPHEPVARLMQKYDGYMNLIHDNWWGNVYPVHDPHFHKNFKEFCNCPFTSLTEVVDCLDKIIQGRTQ